MHSIGEWWLWLLFFIIIAVVLGVDLFLYGGNKQHQVSLKESFIWTGVWVNLALSFNLFLWLYLAQTSTIQIANDKALEFFTAYLIEKSLSMDNLFVFVLIFKYFSIPINYQRRLLLFGVVGAIICRLVFILLGIWLISKFDWVFYFFGLLLLYSALKVISVRGQEQTFTNNFIFKTLSKFIPVKNAIKDERFFVLEKNKRYITPLFIILIFIEISDLVFAIDSIPAVFGITKDPFIAFTSNVFAVLGLRAMYFILADLQNKFQFLDYGLSIILGFIGLKLICHNFIEIPVWITFVVVVSVLTISMMASKVFRKT